MPEPAERAADSPNKQFSLAAVMKLMALLSAVLAIRAATGEYVLTSILAGAVLGVFLAEHFATSRRWEMILLLGVPLASGMLAMTAPAVLEISNPSDLQNVAFLATMSILVGIVPSVLGFVLVCVFSACVDRLTGIRLVKYRWNEEYREPNP